MVMNHKSYTDVKIDHPATKVSQVIELLMRPEGASLEEMSSLANWLPHSTRAFLTGLKKKGMMSAATRSMVYVDTELSLRSANRGRSCRTA